MFLNIFQKKVKIIYSFLSFDVIYAFLNLGERDLLKSIWSIFTDNEGYLNNKMIHNMHHFIILNAKILIIKKAPHKMFYNSRK